VLQFAASQGSDFSEIEPTQAVCLPDSSKCTEGINELPSQASEYSEIEATQARFGVNAVESDQHNFSDGNDSDSSIEPTQRSKAPPQASAVNSSAIGSAPDYASMSIVELKVLHSNKEYRCKLWCPPRS
jgi:hypothetical protein